MKRKVLLFVLMLGLCVGTASAQLGSGIVYDPTNYQNALLRYQQLQQHLLQLQQSYAKITSQLELATQMATFIRNMPARYRALFSQWRNVTSLNTFGNTGSWVSGINSGLLPNINRIAPSAVINAPCPKLADFICITSSHPRRSHSTARIAGTRRIST